MTHFSQAMLENILQLIYDFMVSLGYLIKWNINPYRLFNAKSCLYIYTIFKFVGKIIS